MTLTDELEVIDQTLAELDGRRTEIVNQMVCKPTRQKGKLVQFPRRDAIRVQVYTHEVNRHIW